MNKLTVIALLLVAFVCVSTYLIIFQSYHSYGQFLAAFCVFTIFASILVLQFLLVDVSPNSIWTSGLRTILTILLMFPVSYGLIKAENNYENHELKAYGIHKIALISSTYKTESLKGGIYYNAAYQYTDHGEIYTYHLTNRKNVFKYGDTVELIYSSNHPQIHMVTQYKRAYLLNK